MRTAQVLSLLVLLFPWFGAVAQSPALHGAVTISIATQPEVRLEGPWKFAPGDSPWTNGAFSWANPGLDDSQWTTMELDAAASRVDSAYGDSGYVTGWSARGFPHLAGFAWYRMRLHVTNPGGRVWLKMPDHVDDSYQVYANGEYVGQFGVFRANGVESYRSRPLAFELPPPDANGDIVLAFRFYMEPMVLAVGTTGDSGGMHEAPVAGSQEQVVALRDREVTGRILEVMFPLFISCFLLIAAAGAFWIWTIDRPRVTFLWLMLGFLFLSLPAIILAVAFFSFVLTQEMMNLASETCSAVGIVCWTFFWRNWFNLPRSRRLQAVAAFILALACVTYLLLFGTHESATLAMTWIKIRVLLNALLAGLLFSQLFQGFRRDRVGALIALPPILLLAISQFNPELVAWMHWRTRIFFYGIGMGTEGAALLLLALVTGALAVRRFIGSQITQRLERQVLDQELEQARELQRHVLVPERNTSPAFAVETAYHPARTVGGDFFQVVAYEDGSLLVVVGDVSGKGMAAAMLVSVLVGAARTRAEETRDPAAILQTLNERLLGRAADHFATCVAACLHPDGTMLLANAGHLPPYRNGVPIDLPGSMPLGIVHGGLYDVQTVALAPGDYLAMVTDGVLEARDATGNLLGFDQLARLSRQSPEEIAQAAIAYGQEDDITVVGIRVTGASASRRGAEELEASPA